MPDLFVLAQAKAPGQFGFDLSGLVLALAHVSFAW